MNVTCDRCQLELSATRMLENPSVCDHCGQVQGQKQKDEEALDPKGFQALTLLFTVFLLAAYVHLVNWDRHFFQVFYLKIAQVSGQASSGQLRSMAAICKERQKPECELKALLKLLEREKYDVAATERVAEILFALDRHDDLVSQTQAFLASAQKSSKVNYLLGLSYQKRNQVELALAHYQKALQENDKVLQVSVSENYVKLMMKEGRYTEAKRFIDGLRKVGAPKYFLFTEYQEIQSKLKNRS